MKKKVYRRAKSRSDHELRTLALAVHVGRIVTNVQVQEHQWQLYALRQPPLNIEFVKLTRTDMAKLKRFSKEIKVWEKGARRYLKS
jgi:hypothetical protein